METDHDTITITITGEDIHGLVHFDSRFGEDIETSWVGVRWSNGIDECRTFIEANAADYQGALDNDVTGTLLFDRLDVHCMWAGSQDTPDHRCWDDESGHVEDPTPIGVTCDIEYDLSQVVDLPDGDHARERVIAHYGQIWADHVRRLAAERGYTAETYWGGDERTAHSIRTETPIDSPYETVEAELFQAAHDSFAVSQDDIDRIADEDPT